MSESVSVSLVVQAIMPGICLAVVGFAWLYWGKSIRALPGTLFSLGAALLALVSMVVLAYSTPLVHAFDEVIWLVFGVTLLVYLASLLGCVRFANAKASGVIAFGSIGLIPLWHVGGFVLMNSVCSFGTAGC